MRKNILSLIEVSKNKDMDASLPFVFTTANGEHKTVWFNFSSIFNGNVCDLTVKKIFLLSEHNNIETLDVNINIKVIATECKFPLCDKSRYIEKFNDQFNVNKFDDALELVSMAEQVTLLDLYEAVIDYLKKPRKMTCKHCGSDIGFFTKLTGVQYYTNTGDEDGYTVDSQNTSVYCRSCKKRVCSFEEFRKGASNGY